MLKFLGELSQGEHLMIRCFQYGRGSQ